MIRFEIEKRETINSRLSALVIGRELHRSARKRRQYWIRQVSHPVPGAVRVFYNFAVCGDLSLSAKARLQRHKRRGSFVSAQAFVESSQS